LFLFGHCGSKWTEEKRDPDHCPFFLLLCLTSNGTAQAAVQSGHPNIPARGSQYPFYLQQCPVFPIRVGTQYIHGSPYKDGQGRGFQLRYRWATSSIVRYQSTSSIHDSRLFRAGHVSILCRNNWCATAEFPGTIVPGTHYLQGPCSLLFCPLGARKKTIVRLLQLYRLILFVNVKGQRQYLATL
jgi:hypothetical protein